MGDASFEVVVETLHGSRQALGIICHDAGAQITRDRARRRLVAGRDAGLELRPLVGRHLHREIAHPVRQAALPSRAREAFLNRPDDAWCPVAGHQDRIAKPASAHVLKERAYRLGVLRLTTKKMQKDLLPIPPDPPGGDHWLARAAGPQPLGNAVNKQVDDVELRQIAAREGLIFLPQPLRDLAYRRAAHQTPPSASVNAASMSRVDSPRANSSTAKSSNASVRPARFSRTADTKGSAVSRNCGAENFTAPSAVFSRPVR